MRPVPAVTATVLAGFAGLHVAWAAGSSFPCRDRRTLADVVAGTDEVPGPVPSVAVAALLGAAAVLVGDVAPVPTRWRSRAVVVVAGVLGVRGVAGVTGRTRLLVPSATSPAFVRRDRHMYGPLCLALAAGAAASLRR